MHAHCYDILINNIFIIFSLAFIHDAVLQWAYGVNKTVEQGYSPDDGFRITQNILNLQFEGMTGPVVIDEIGNRRPDFR